MSPMNVKYKCLNQYYNQYYNFKNERFLSAIDTLQFSATQYVGLRLEGMYTIVWESDEICARK